MTEAKQGANAVQMQPEWTICALPRYEILPAASRTKSAFDVLYTNDNKAELMIVVTVVICRLTQKYAQMQHPLFGM